MFNTSAPYCWYWLIAKIRGYIYRKNYAKKATGNCTFCGLNGPGEAKLMYEKHGWIPYIYYKDAKVFRDKDELTT